MQWWRACVQGRIDLLPRGNEWPRARVQRLRLCRARRRSLRFLCLRIFLRRFLITLPTDSPASNVARGAP